MIGLLKSIDNRQSIDGKFIYHVSYTYGRVISPLLSKQARLSGCMMIIRFPGKSHC